MESVIFVRLMGGIGNQLFQYLAGVLQTRTTSGKLYLCSPMENKHDTTDYRNIMSLGEKYDNPLSNIRTLYQEDGFASWNPEDYKNQIIYMYGYFQHYPTVKNIIREFRQNLIMTLYNDRYLMFQKYEPTLDSGFIHVRRGDYLGLSEVLPLSYYENALNFISKKITKWYLFSDDIEWCKQQTIFKNMIFVEENTVNSLSLMSMITGSAIIANSTFSWWGAMLGVGLNSDVIYPLKWLDNKKPDLFPEMWKGID